MKRIDIFPSDDGQCSYTDCDSHTLAKYMEVHDTNAVHCTMRRFAESNIPVYIHFKEITKQEPDGRLYLMLNYRGFPVIKQ